ncbi:hypothetical protein C0Q70_08610 [Pomacea canaliculata]|uniref:Uncharacterized protein n=1 Tax=Pomacea canaliculata TaxID=400727 RepID=A0A2T7PIA7_POMCA|nr:hypothetical protein C0Q70_08610 [Pomacea canaliculata]
MSAGRSSSSRVKHRSPQSEEKEVGINKTPPKGKSQNQRRGCESSSSGINKRGQVSARVDA